MHSGADYSPLRPKAAFGLPEGDKVIGQGISLEQGRVNVREMK